MTNGPPRQTNIAGDFTTLAFCSRPKYSSYWIDCHEILFRYSWCPEELIVSFILLLCLTLHVCVCFWVPKENEERKPHIHWQVLRCNCSFCHSHSEQKTCPPSCEHTCEKLSIQAVKQLQEKRLHNLDSRLRGSLSLLFKATWAALLMLPTPSEDKSG